MLRKGGGIFSGKYKLLINVPISIASADSLRTDSWKNGMIGAKELKLLL